MGILWPPYRAIEFLTSTEFLWGLLWVGMGIFAVDLLLLMETRWGHSKLIRKCLVLSILFHVLLIGYSKSIELVALLPSPALQSTPIRVTFNDRPMAVPNEQDETAPNADMQQSSDANHPWEVFSSSPASVPLPKDRVARLPTANKIALQRSPDPKTTELLDAAPLPEMKWAAAASPQPGVPKVPQPTVRTTPLRETAAIDVPAAQRQDIAQTMVPVAALPAHADMPRPTLIVPVKIGSSNPDVTAMLDAPANLPPVTVTSVTYHPPETVTSDDGYAGLSNPSTCQGFFHGSGSASENRALAGPILLPAGPAPAEQLRQPTPEIYKLRTVPDHVSAAQQQGATAATEAAVKAALLWLAQAQAADGHWSAIGHGAGKESHALGRERPGAGATADTGITGLALLALLASGHTHREGEYCENVRRGLEYLMRVQESDGNLGGQGNIYEAMYCHAIATYAMSEALGMTNDPLLRSPVSRAIHFTIVAQDRGTGGWRYRPGDPGDTSQLGWQFMALKSAGMAGIDIPNSTREGTIKFLQSVAMGKNGGLASYRPQERPSRTMTAEALFCWQLLDQTTSPARAASDQQPAEGEAVSFLLAELPNQSRPNLYYWYYATLAMHQRQGDDWLRWNQALQESLITTQRNKKEESTAGSWDPDPLWGGYGGRVYSTALSALCLEVYYRFLPLYKETASRPALQR